MHGHKKVAGAVALAADPDGAAPFGKTRANTSVFENWNQPEQQNCEKRDAESEYKNARIDANVGDAWQSGRCKGDEKT